LQRYGSAVVVSLILFAGFVYIPDGQAQTFDLTDFSNESIINSGLTAPIALGFLPDNRMLVLEKGGTILIADPNNGNREVYLDISSIVNSGQERGLLEIAIPPDFDPSTASGKNFIYLFYTRGSNTNRAVIGRFTHSENAGGLASRADANSEQLLWTDTDGFVSCCHYGGGLDFGPDGNIWLTSSDKFNTSNQGEGGPDDNWPVNMEVTSGKIIRIEPDGSIPADNPYAGGNTTVAGPYPAANDPVFGADFTPHPSVWAYGLRNPFRADWDEEYGYFYIGEVGGNQGGSWDDIHLASLDQKEVFYGWNFYEGVVNFEPKRSETNFSKADFPQPDTDLADPANGDYYSAAIYAIPHTSLTGGFVYRGSMFPPEFDGVYFFGNYETNYIKFLDLDATGTSVEGVYDFKPSNEIPGAPSNVVFLEEGIDGALYYINYSGSGGEVQRIVYNGLIAPTITDFKATDTQGDPDDQFGPVSPLDVTFTATAGDPDTDLSNLTYSINFGDGSPAQNGSPDATTGAISVPHTYTAEDRYSAVLSVSDGARTTLSSPLEITVGDPNDAPEFVSVAADPKFGDPPLTVTFTAEVTDADADDPVESLIYTLDFGDGSTPATGNPDASGLIEVAYTYTDPGQNGPYNAIFTLSDGEAAPVSSAPLAIQVGPASGLPVTDGLVFQVESFIKVGIANDGTTVTEWLDESGQGNNLAAAGDPQYIENATPSGLPAIELDGAGDYLVDAATLTGFSVSNEPRTMFFVVDYEAVTNNEFAGLVYGTDANNQAFGLTLNGNANELAIQGWGGTHDRASDVNGVIDPATSQQRGFISHAVVYDGTTYSHYLNGQLIDSGTKNYATTLGTLFIGQNLNGGEVPLSTAAAFIYNRALNANEFTSVENYIQDTYLTSGGNGQPVATADAYNATSGEQLTVPSSTGLLNNDTDDGTITVVSVNGQSLANSPFTLTNGTLTVEASGAFTYTSAASFIGPETFTYRISDGSLIDDADVTIEVSAPSPSTVPAAEDLVAYFESDLNVIQNGGTVSEWLSGAGTNMDLVAAGDPTFVTNVTPSGQAAISFDGDGDKLSRTTAGGQSVGPLPTGNASRSMYFVVDYQKMNGVYAGVTYGQGAPNKAFGLVLNGNGGLLTVQGWGGGNDYIASDEDGLGSIDGGSGDDWFIHSVRYDGNTIRHYRNDELIDTETHPFNTVVESFVIGEEIAGAGFAELDVAALFLYDKELNDSEHAQVLQYLTNKYLATNPTNQPPVANDDTAVTDEDTPVNINVLNGDTDADGTIAGVTKIDGQNATVDQPVALTSGATATLRSDATVDYDPNGQFESLNDGQSDSDAFTYVIQDDDGAESIAATVTVTITGITDQTGGGPSNNPVTSTLIASFESDMGLSTSGGTVTGWNDAYNTYNLTGVFSDPTLMPNASPSGQHVIEFSGSDYMRILGTDVDLSGLPGGDAPRTLYFVVDYKGQGNFAGFGYGDDEAFQNFALVTDTDEFLTIDGWTGPANRTSTTEGVNTLGWIVQSVVLDGPNYKHYIYTEAGGLQLIDSGTDGAFNTDNSTESALFLGGKASGTSGGKMDIAAALIYDSALSTGSDELGGDHAAVSQYLFSKYLASSAANMAPVADDDSATTDEDTPISIDVLDGDTDSDGTIAAITLIDAQTATVGQAVTLSSGATATLQSNGQISYDPNGQFEALDNGDTGSDNFTYTIEDNEGAASNAATVTITINGVTDPTGGGPGSNPVTSTLIASFESDFGLNTNAGTVTGWDDFYDTYDLTGVSGNPQLVTGGTPAGEDAVALDGTGDFLRILGTDVDLSGLPGGSSPRTLYFVVDYKTQGEFTGFGYGDDQAFENFGLVTDSDELLTIDGWTGPANRTSTTEGVITLDWMVQSVVLDGADYKHYIYTATGGLQLIDSGTDGAFNTDVSTEAALFLGGKPGGNVAGEMDVAAALIYNSALSTGTNDLGGDHAAVSQYLYNKYLATPGANNPPVADDDSATTDEDTPVSIDVLDGDTDSDGTIAGVTLIDAQTATVGQPVTLTSGATATLQSDGTITYDPNGQFEALNTGDSSSDNFTYTIEDDDGAASNAATVTVTITGITDPTGGGPGNNPVTATLIASFESDFGVATNSGTVTSWSDFYDDYDLTGVTGNPQLVASGTPSGKDAVAFDGDDFLRIFGTDVDLTGLPGGDAPRTLYFVVDYKTQGNFTGFGYGDNQSFQNFGLVTDTDELLAIDGWTSAANRTSTTEGVTTVGWMVQSVVLDGPNYKHYIYTDPGGLQLIDSGTDGAFNTDNTTEAALVIAGKVTGTAAAEMDVAAALIYNSALSTGSNDLGGDHAIVSQYLFDKYLSTVALPVELMTFRAEVNADNPFTDLYWTTATEQDNDYFSVERSADGMNFTPIGEVAGAGTTRVPQSYTFQDRRPHSGTNYYRLRQVDFDGAFAFSKVVAVHHQLPEETDLRLLPNPTTGGVEIVTPSFATAQTISLHDLAGRELRRWELLPNANRLTVDLSQLASGTYIVRTVGNGSSLVARLIKQ
jgi:glucose/arabinose dehydrogenase